MSTVAPLPELPPQTTIPVLMIDVGGKPILPLCPRYMLACANEKVLGRVRVIESHDGTLQDLNARLPTQDTRLAISVHGNSSASVGAKKSYTIELRDEAGADRDLPLLGMPADSDWILYHCFLDPTYVRNALAYAVGRTLGRWAPRTRYVELMIDGKYQGLYMVVEKIKRGRHRVPIGKPADTAAGDLTGGYILAREGDGKGVDRMGIPRFFKTKAGGTVWTYRFPEQDEITPEQKAYLQQHMESFDARLKSAEWADPVRGYAPLIDLPSWVDFSLMQELSHNVDAYRKSAYVYKTSDAQGGRLVMGPLWDFDFAFANPAVSWDPTFQRADAGWDHIKPGEVPFFWAKLWSDPPFRNALACRFRELRQSTLDEGRLFGQIDAYVKLLTPIEARDRAIWKPFNKKPWAEELTLLRTFISQRLRWMDANLPGTCR